MVLNTCAVRENADNRLYGNLGHLKSAKERKPRMRIVVAAAWRRRTAARSSGERRGSTSSSGRTRSRG